MRGGRTTWALTALVSLFLMVPTVTALQGSWSLTTELPIQVDGQHEARGDGASFLLEGDGGTASFLLEARHGTLERILHRAYGVVNRDDPQLSLLMNQRVEHEEVPLTSTFITLHERLPDFQLLAFDAEPVVVPGAARGPLHIGGLFEARTVASEAEPPIQLSLGGYESDPFTHVLPVGMHALRADDARVTIEAPFSLYWQEAHVRITGGDLFHAGFREEQRPGTIYDPVEDRWIGDGEHTEYVYEHHELHVTDGRIHIQYLGTPGTLYDDAASVSVLGELTFPNADGAVVLDDGTRHEIDGDLSLAGDLSFVAQNMDTTAGRTAVTGAGDVTAVTYAQESHTYDWAVAAGIGAILLGALAWVTGALKWAIAAVGGLFTGYARVQGDDILEHPGRAKVYELVKADPGISFVDLGERLEFGASTLNYHLRVLEKNDFVTRVKDGRYVRFFDRQDGHYSRDRKTKASTLRNENTAAIAAAIIEHPGIAQRDLARAFEIAPSTVSWHITRLQKEGLVTKQRDHHFTRYYMGAGWSDLPAAELARVGLVA